MPTILACYGSRPDSIKMQPVLDALEAYESVKVVTFDANQSPDLTGTDTQFSLWKNGLVDGIALTMVATRAEIDSVQPDAVIVQGDMATTLACALAAWFKKVPIAHVEAGMRTYKDEPWPEERIRQIVTKLATWHFCPSDAEADNIMEGFGSGRQYDDVFVTGNTVIDTLPKQPMRVLATLHRRENWGGRMEAMLEELNILAGEPNVNVTVIRHPNWKDALSADFEKTLGALYIRNPYPRSEMLEHLALRTFNVIVTDSGGLQEEAAYYCTPCFVYRHSTERQVLESLGAVRVSPHAAEIADWLWNMYDAKTVYGTGDAGKRIAKILVERLEAENGQDRA